LIAFEESKAFKSFLKKDYKSTAFLRYGKMEFELRALSGELLKFLKNKKGEWRFHHSPFLKTVFKSYRAINIGTAIRALPPHASK
jgi:hypothetical protein